MGRVVLVLLSVLMSWSVSAESFEEGTHYEALLLGKQTRAPEVREFFSYYCIHCYRFESKVEAIKAGLPKGVSFAKTHVDFMPYKNPEMRSGIVRSFLALEMMGAEADVGAKLFERLHKRRLPLESLEDVADVVAEAGLNRQEFMDVVDSFPVAMAEHKAKDRQRYAQLRGVPSLVVNGKFRINMGKVNEPEELNRLIEYLLQK